MTTSRWLATLAVVMPIVAYGQPVKGGSAANLSDRAQFYAYYSGTPDNASIELLVILRGQPRWMRPGSGTVRESVGPVFIDERVPLQHSLTIGSKEFEYTYHPGNRTLAIGESRYPLDSANVVVIDRVDGVGGPPTVVRQLHLDVTGKASSHALHEWVMNVPELQDYIR
ncbi:MAG TPA: hypothetical protein VH762_07205 [Gemmatimonadaceae bacterium]